MQFIAEDEQATDDQQTLTMEQKFSAQESQSAANEVYSSVTSVAVVTEDARNAKLLKRLYQTVQALARETRNRERHNLSEQVIRLLRACPDAAIFRKFLIPMLKCVRRLLVDKEPNIRNQSLRVLRYLLLDREVILEMNKLNIDLFVGRSLEADPKLPWERMNAYKVLQTIMSLDASLVTRAQVKQLPAT